MVRKLKHHEQKLLKKVDFINWEVDNNLHEVKVLRRFRIEKREDYTKYNKLSRNIRDLAQKIRDLDEKDGFRAQSTHQLMEKLDHMFQLLGISISNPLEAVFSTLARCVGRVRGDMVVGKSHFFMSQEGCHSRKCYAHIHNVCDTKYSIGLTPTKQNLSLTEKVTASSFCRRRLPSIMLSLRMAQSLKTAITFIEQGHVRVGPDIVTDPAFLVTRNMEDFVTWVDSSKIRQHVLNYNDERDDFDLLA